MNRTLWIFVMSALALLLAAPGVLWALEQDTDLSTVSGFIRDKAGNMVTTVWGQVHVSPAGNDTTGDGSESTPWRTIQHAVDQASAGDTIKVMDDDDEATDDYVENVRVIDKRVAIERYDDTGANPQVKASNANDFVFYVRADSVAVKGLDIYGATASQWAGICLYGASGCTIQDNRCGWDSSHKNFSGIILISLSNNNTISGNTCSSNDNLGIYLRDSSGNTVSGNTCSNNAHGLGMWLLRSSHNTISGNTGSNNDIWLVSSSHNTISGNTCSISLQSSSHNTISGNTCSDNSYHGIDLSSSSNNNTISGNTCSNNSSDGINLSSSSDNTIYLNNFSNNNPNVSSDDGSTNTWHSPTKLSYLYGGPTQTYKSYMANFYSDYSGSDGDGDGIGDSPHDLPGDEPNDDYPLMQTTDNYDLQMWVLANPVMYRGDMSKPGATVSIVAGGSEIWCADSLAQTDMFFGAGDQSDLTSWTGLLTFTSAPDDGDNFTLEVGYADDQDGAGFWDGGPEATLTGDGSVQAFTYATDAVSFIIAQGKHLALRITNHSASSDTIRVGGSWSYCAAPPYLLGDVSGNREVRAYDAALILQYTVGLIDSTDWPLLTVPVADVSGDTTISAYDASLILQYVVGKLSEFPVEGSPKGVASSPRRVGFAAVEQQSDGSFVVPIVIDEISGVFSGQIEMAFDPALLRVVQVKKGEVIGDYMFVSNILEGTVLMSFAGTGLGAGGGRLAEVIFESLESGGDVLSGIRLQRVQLNEGRLEVVSVPEVEEQRIPTGYGLEQNWPNPFNAATKIRFDLPEAGEVALTIYNLSGQRIRILVDGYREAGSHAVLWDGKDSHGREVASGIYLYRIAVNHFTQCRKMVVIK